MIRIIFAAALVLAMIVTALAYPHLEGYSGAPGTSGMCASTCHGTAGGTIEVSGFPDQYLPNATYTLMVTHDGGSPIVNFNASCRVGSGSDQAGTIAAGTNTATYALPQEFNGVHFSEANKSNGSFEWTAPAGGTGDVTLYLAGLQGDYGGANTALVLVSSENTGPCCDIRGDINHDGVGPDIADLVHLVSYMFQPPSAPPVCEQPSGSGYYAEADINGDDVGPDIADLVHMVSYMFQPPSPEPVACP